MRGAGYMQRLPQFLSGGAVTLVLVAGVALLSQWPQWRSLPEDTGLVRLSFTHSGKRACRDRTEEELASLPANMRARQLCERRRSPVQVAVEIDGRVAFAAELPPSGISGSGPSRAYERFILPTGPHRLVVTMRDDPQAGAPAYQGQFEIELARADSVAIDFDPVAGAFFLH